MAVAAQVGIRNSYKVDIYMSVLHAFAALPVLTLLDSSENGVVCPNENELPREQAVQDDFRIAYLESYADQIALKIAEGVPIKSYLMWAWTVSGMVHAGSEVAADFVAPIFRTISNVSRSTSDWEYHADRDFGRNRAGGFHGPVRSGLD